MSNIYSNRDFTGQDLSDKTDMDGLVIENSCFSQEIVNRQILPPSLVGATFRYCNMDNVYVPSGVVLENCSHRFFHVQDDGQDWLIDPDTRLPIRLLNEA